MTISRNEQGGQKPLDGGLSELESFDGELGPQSVQSSKSSADADARRAEQKYIDVLEVTAALTSTLNVTDLLNSVVDGIVRVTRCERGFIYLKDADGSFKRHLGRSADQADNQQDDISQSIVNRVVKDRKPFIEPDLRQVDDLRHSGSIQKHAIRSAICLPLLFKEDLIGVIYADSHFVVPEVLESDHSILQAFAAQAAVAIDNARQHGELLNSRASLEGQNISLRQQLSKDFMFSGMISKNKSMLEVFETVEKIAGHDINVLINGESGTGKELLARAIHERSDRRDRNFETVNCAGIPSGLVESILFGHAKGSFTGATQDKRGVFELADGGTLFLDEIGDMPLEMQPKILRAVQEGEIRRVGEEERARKIDVRIITATHVDLTRAIRDGRFRQDLYFRLNQARVSLPPLRDRREDIVPLAELFLKKYSDDKKKPLPTLAQDAQAYLVGNEWIGNVRELKSAVAWGIAFQDEKQVIRADELKKFFHKDKDLTQSMLPKPEAGVSLKEQLNKYEEALLREILSQNDHNITLTAKVLEISRQQLHNKIKKFGISTKRV